VKKVLYILGEMNDDDVEWVLVNSNNIRLSPDSVLIEQGKPIDALYILLDGVLTVVTDANPTEPIATLNPGEIVGEISFVDSRPPTATVKAPGNAVVLSIPRAHLVDKLQQDTGFASRFYRALAVFLSHRLRDTDSHLGYGKVQVSDDEIEGELDDSVLDNVYLAGTRFDRMLKRFAANS